jgi:hypothetical protein
MARVKHFLAMWCCEGLECIFDINKAKKVMDNYEKEKVINILKEEPAPRKPNPIPLQSMVLRARYNSQRQYEIYEFQSTISEKEIKNIFNEDPQIIVDWIRKNGYKIYSDYRPMNKNKII